MADPAILIVNQNWMGDVLFSTPALRAIRKKFPKSRITCMAPARCREVLERNPHLDEVLVYDEKLSWFSFPAMLALVARLKSKKFDKAILLHRSKSKALLMRLAGIPERIGFEAPGREAFLTQGYAPPVKAVHKIDYFLHLTTAAGFPLDGRFMDFSFKEGELALLTQNLQNLGVSANEPYIVVHVGGNWDLKRWPLDSFGAWLKIFLKRYGWKVVLCGTEGEKKLSDKLREIVSDERVISLCGKTSVPELAALLKNARLLVSNDSGPIHLAASQSTPIVGIFGPTSPELTGPVSRGPLVILKKDVGCQVPCYFADCDYRVCIDKISPEEVLSACEEILK